MLKREIILKALERLGELAHEENLLLHVCIYGGSAMMLAYDSRMITKDVDVIMHPSERGLALAEKVGKEMGLHANWLNDDVRFYASEFADRGGLRDLPIDIKGLKLEIPTANYLLAMKARACREPVPGHEVDSGDLRFLISKMKIRSIEEVEARLEKFFPENPLTAQSRNIIQRLIEEVRNGKGE